MNKVKQFLAIIAVLAVFLLSAGCRKGQMNQQETIVTAETTVQTETQEIVYGDGIISGVVAELEDEEVISEEDKKFEAYEDPEPTKPSGTTTNPSTQSKPITQTKPSGNNSSSKPTASSKPSNTGSSSKPTTSTNPTNPASPTSPTTPTSPITPTNPTTPTTPNQPTTPASPATPTIPQESVPEQPGMNAGVGTPDDGTLSEYDEYMNMNATEQAQFINSFDSIEAFMEWFNKAKDEANANSNSIEIGSGVIDLGQLSGNK